MSLQPVNSEKDVFQVLDFGLKPSKHPNEFFRKTLTASDTSTHGGFSVPRRSAEKLFLYWITQCLIGDQPDSITMPYYSQGRIPCLCSACASATFEENVVKIVKVKLGYVTVVVKLKTEVCEPNNLVAVGESGRLHLWIMNSTWRKNAGRVLNMDAMEICGCRGEDKVNWVLALVLPSQKSNPYPSRILEM